MIEVNEYVRINIDNRNCIGIGRVTKIVNETIYVKMNNKYNLPVSFQIDKVVKHSKQLIDLIEVGDYANGCEVLDIHIPRDIWDPVEIRINSRYANFLLADEIKTIVTKEQMASIEYRVEED